MIATFSSSSEVSAETAPVHLQTTRSGECLGRLPRTSKTPHEKIDESQQRNILSAREIGDLRQHEEMIQRQEFGWVEEGKALMAIRDGGLYREGYRTFEEYWRARWQMARAQAYRLIAGARMMAILSPGGDIKVSERHIRVLNREPIELARKIWRRATRKAGGSVVTGRMLQAAADEIRGRKRKSNRKEAWQISSETIIQRLGQTIQRGDKSGAKALLIKLELMLGLGSRGDTHAED